MRFQRYTRAMRILMLGNSNDITKVAGRSRGDVIRDLMAAEFGEPVEVVVRATWPTPRMAEMASGWAAEFEPDLVFLLLGSFWFQHESVPLRLQRVLGRIGTPVGDAGFKLADSKRWGHNRAFRALRRAAQLTIGGDSHFTPEQVTERSMETIRALARHESSVLVVQLPMGTNRYGSTERRQRALERKRISVHDALARFCDQVHVPYGPAPRPQYLDEPKGTRVGDGVHLNESGHVLRAEQYFAVIRDAWRAHLGVPAMSREGEAGG